MFQSAFEALFKFITKHYIYQFISFRNTFTSLVRLSRINNNKNVFCNDNLLMLHLISFYYIQTHEPTGVYRIDYVKSKVTLFCSACALPSICTYKFTEITAFKVSNCSKLHVSWCIGLIYSSKLQILGFKSSRQTCIKTSVFALSHVF